MKKFLVLLLLVVQFGLADDLDIQISGNLKAILGSSQSTDWSVVSATDVSASGTVSAATFIFSASGIPLYIGDTTTSDSGKALIYDATANSVNLLPITDYLDFATVGSSLNFGDISDVSVEFAAEGWVPAWNAASEIWEATPAAEFTPSITESEVATMIQSATESLTPSEIGAIDTAAMNTAIETAVSNATSTLTFDEISNVSMTAKVDGVIPYWNAAESVWDATPQASGWTGTGATALSDLTDVAINTPSDTQLLGYNGSNWTNVDAPAGGGGAPSVTIVVAASDSIGKANADYVCDASADDVQINAALAELSNGGEVRLLEGNYYLADTITIPTSSITISGIRNRTVLVRQFSPASEYADALVYVGSKNSVSIKNIRFNGVSATYSTNKNALVGSNGIFSNLSIDGCYFENAYYGVYSYGNTNNTGFIGNSYFCSLSYGVLLTGSPGGNNYNIANNYLESCSWYGISCDSGGTIQGNTLYSCGIGIYAGSYAKYTQILNNRIISGTGYGISVDYNGKFVSGNYIYAGTVGIDMGNATLGVASNNFVEACTSHGIQLDTLFDRCSIVGNTVRGCGGNGIHCYNGTDVTILSNISYGNSGDGIQLYAVSEYTAGVSLNRVIGNTVSLNTGRGISLLNAEMVVLKDNIFDKNTSYQLATSTAYQDPTVCYSNGNVYNGNDNTKPLIYVGGYDVGVPASGSVFSTNDTFKGTYSAPIARVYSFCVYTVNNGQFDTNGIGSVIIASSSSTACIGFATDELTSIDHVITVAPDATTNPIATSWDTWSLPELKSGIASVSDDKKRSSVGNIGALKLIEYDWKYNEPEPVIAKEDIGTATETAIRQGWEKRRAAWERQKNKVKSWSADITDPSFPAELGSYNAEGKLTGINNTAVIWRLVGAVQELQAEVERLKFGGKN